VRGKFCAILAHLLQSAGKQGTWAGKQRVPGLTWDVLHSAPGVSCNAVPVMHVKIFNYVGRAFW